MNLSPKTVDDRLLDTAPTVFNYDAMRKEIEQGRKKAADDREEAIKKRCKK